MASLFPVPSLPPGASPTQNSTEDNHNDRPIKIKQAISQEAEEKGNKDIHLQKEVNPGSGISRFESLQGNSHSWGFRAGRRRAGLG